MQSLKSLGFRVYYGYTYLDAELLQCSAAQRSASLSSTNGCNILTAAGKQPVSDLQTATATATAQNTPRNIRMALTPSSALFNFGVNGILSSGTGHWQMKALLKEVSSLHILQLAVNLLTSSNLKYKRIGYPLIKGGYSDGIWFTCICVHVYMYVGLRVHNNFLSKGWQTCLAVVNNPWQCNKLIRYGNKCNKCIRTCKSITYYIIQIVCFLDVLASLRWL